MDDGQWGGASSAVLSGLNEERFGPDQIESMGSAKWRKDDGFPFFENCVYGPGGEALQISASTDLF